MKKLIVSMLVMIMIFCLTGLSSAECNGPFTYEQMNRDHKSIFNEFISGAEWCKEDGHGLNDVLYFEFGMMKQLMHAYLFDMMSANVRSINPQGSRNLAAKSAEIKMLMQMVADNIQDRRRQRMWQDTKIKWERMVKSNPKMIALAKQVAKQNVK